MGVRTTADEHLDSAGESVKQAIKDINAVLFEECWGHDEYRDDYRDTLYEVYHKLVDIKRRLNR